MRRWICNGGLTGPTEAIGTSGFLLHSHEPAAIGRPAVGGRPRELERGGRRRRWAGSADCLSGCGGARGCRAGGPEWARWCPARGIVPWKRSEFRPRRVPGERCQLRSLLPRLPSEMQWLKTFQVPTASGLDAFHCLKAAKLRASGPGGCEMKRGGDLVPAPSAFTCGRYS
jgi:hypothetical protein